MTDILQVVRNTKVNNIIYINRQFQHNLRGTLRKAYSDNIGSRYCTFKNQEREPQHKSMKEEQRAKKCSRVSSTHISACETSYGRHLSLFCDILLGFFLLLLLLIPTSLLLLEQKALRKLGLILKQNAWKSTRMPPLL